MSRPRSRPAAARARNSLTEAAVVAAAWALLAKPGTRLSSWDWGAHAAHLKVSPATLRTMVQTPSQLLRLLVTSTDAACLTSAPEGATRQEQLFDALMRRYEQLAPHRSALRQLLAGAASPRQLAALARLQQNSMAKILRACGARAAWWQVTGLWLVYGATLPVFLADNSPDLAKTMAALDKNLRRVGQLATMLSAVAPT